MARPLITNPSRDSAPSRPRNRSSPSGREGLAVRRAAHQILLRVERDRAFADVLLGQRLRDFGTADRGLLTQLVLGTLTWQGRLDFELAHYCSRPLDQIAAELLVALRLGLFQLRILTRIPPHAAIDTAVTLVHESQKAAAGFVNAVLRSATRRSIALPARTDGEIYHLSIAYSHPQWLVRKFIEWFGVPDAEALMAANNQPAPNVLRLNLALAPADDIAARLASQSLTVIRNGRFPETARLNGTLGLDRQAWRDGLFQPQSEASQMVARLLAPSTGALVVDCSAAPGGKATHLAELTGPQGKVIALDINLAGLRKTRSVAGRLGHNHVLLACADALSSLPVRNGSADFVLLDAPCTGLGTLREHPEIRWRLQPQDLQRLASLQQRMLEQVATIIAVDGIMVYSVCSVAPPEGPDVVNAFIARHRNFEVDHHPPATQLHDLLSGDGFLRTRPDHGGMDGFFAARLKRVA